MRKLLLAAAAAAVLVPGVASAQSAKEVRHDQREVNKDQHQVRQDVARGQFNKARNDRQETREDRRETRQDWQDYRKSNRNAFHRSAYVAPRGLRYRAIGVGARLNNAFWGTQYRLPNYATYRLSAPGRNQAYVRYGNDVLLINTRTGRVVRVFNSFFW